MVIHNEKVGTIFKIKRFSIHDGPGIRTTVFLKGCPLKCTWCHSPEGITPDISIWFNENLCIACGQCVQSCPEKALDLIKEESFVKINRELCNISGNCVNICPSNAMQFTGSRTTVSEVIKEIEKDIAFYKTSGGGVTLSGGEPLYQPEFSAEILELCKKRDIHTAIETCLFCERDVINRISDKIDLFIIDIKLFEPYKHKYYTGKSNEIIIENFRYLAGLDIDIHVRIPLIDNITDTDDNLKEIINLIKETGKNIKIEKIRYNPLSENSYKRLGIPFIIYEI